MKRELEIYRECFGISEHFEELLFKNPLETLKVNDITVSQLFLLPCEIVKNGIKYNCKYIYAAATAPNERKKGYMSLLIRRVTENGIFILRPANNDLIGYYKKLGFSLFTANDNSNIDFSVEPQGEFKILADSEGKTADGRFPLMAINSPVNLNNIYFPYTMP